MSKVKLIFVFLLKSFMNFQYGNSCRQIIEERLYDLSYLRSDNDYLATYKDEDMELNFSFNFCKYTQKKCNQVDPSYYLAAYNTTTCQYYTETTQDKQHYYIIKDDDKHALGINYRGVQETGEYVDFQLFCDKEQKELIVDQVTKDGLIYTLKMRSENACPSIITNMIAEFVQSFKWIFFIIGIIIGPMLLLVGGKLFGITVFIVNQQVFFYTFKCLSCYYS